MIACDSKMDASIHSSCLLFSQWKEENNKEEGILNSFLAKMISGGLSIAVRMLRKVLFFNGHITNPNKIRCSVKKVEKENGY